MSLTNLSLNSQEILLLLLAFIIGLLLGLVLKRRRISGGELCKTLPQNISINFDEIREGKEEKFAQQVKKILKPYAESVIQKSTKFFWVEGVTVCLGEINQKLCQGITIQPIELVNHSISLTYSSVQASGNIKISVIIKATPHSQVFIEGKTDPINIGVSGWANVDLDITREQLKKGYIRGKVIKGGLEEDIKIKI